MTPTHEHTSFPPRTAWRFAAGYGALFLGFGIVTPYLQVLLARRGFGEQEIGTIQGALEVMAVLAPPLWGVLSDRCHRPRLVLAVAALGAIPAFLCFGVCRGLLAAIAVSVWFGMFFRPQIALTDGYTFRYIHRHGGDYGPVRVAGSLAFVVAVVSIELLGVTGEHAVTVILVSFVVAALLQVGGIALLPTDARRESTAPSTGSADGTEGADWRRLFTLTFLIFTFVAFLGRMAMVSYYHFFSLFLEEHLGIAQPGYIWILGPISEIPLIFFSGRIMARIGTKRLFALGLIGVAVRLTCFSFVSSVWQLIPLQLLHALTFGAYHTASVNFVSRLAPPHLKSTAQTVFAALTGGLGGIFGGIIGGWVAETFGYVALYRSFGLLAVVALVILTVAMPGNERGPEAR